MLINSDLISRVFSFTLKSGVEVFPVKMKRRTTGRVAFRVSAGGNKTTDSLEVEEHEMVDKVLNQGYSVRCSSLDRKVYGLYIVGGSSIAKVNRHY